MTVLYDSPTRNLAVYFTDFYLVGFALVLAGYAMFGKGFAYLGMPPIYVGEMALGIGCLAALASGCLNLAIMTGPGLALLPLIVWAAFRTVPYASIYGMDALRDSVIVFYSAFAFIMASILIQRGERLSQLLAHYSRMIPYFVVTLVAITVYCGIFNTEETEFFIGFKPGDTLVQVTGILLFAVLGFRRIGWILSCGIFVIIIVSTALSRGGFVALACAMTLSMWLTRELPTVRRTYRYICAGVIAIGLILICFDIDIPSTREGRNISVRNIVTNLLTIVSKDESGDTQGTKNFREEWWTKIINYTVFGPYFWIGKGFGVNLATSDGFQVFADDGTTALLRTPHNASMTILARSGVPGLVFWFLALGTWVVAMARGLLQARASGDMVWYRFFCLILCWWLAFLVNASFDVALEGPMAGIWFWTLHGTGIASSVIYRHASKRVDVGSA